MNKKQPKRILIAEDELDLSTMMQFILQENKYEVTVCENGKDALESHIKEPFPLIITDLNMPGFDGEFLISELIKREMLPVLLIHTVVSDINKVIEILRKGAYDYILKPIKNKEFIHHVDKAYDYYLLQKYQKSMEKEREIRTNYQFNWNIWQEEVTKRITDKKEYVLFDSLRTNFTQGQGFGALVSTVALIQSLCQLEENVYKVDKEIMDMIFSNVQSLNKVIDLFNEIRQILKNGLELMVGSIQDFYQLCVEITFEMNGFAKQKNQTIQLFQNETQNVDQKLKFHKTYMKTVLKELLFNAFKYSLKDSEVIIMTEILGGQFLVSVLNKPEIEIPEEYSRIIFEPFCRIAGFAYETYPTYDMGLGLTLAEKVIRQHSGRISMFPVKSHLKSESELFYSFQIELPLLKEEM
ncbi:MAG: response regulator [Leptospiraceae bacterium]|nr:response regulator [Leptospiraceae bacterium]